MKPTLFGVEVCSEPGLADISKDGEGSHAAIRANMDGRSNNGSGSVNALLVVN